MVSVPVRGMRDLYERKPHYEHQALVSVPVRGMRDLYNKIRVYIADTYIPFPSPSGE